MEKLELEFIDGKITKIELFPEGKEYILKTFYGYEVVRTRNYSSLADFFTNELGVDNIRQLGKTITLVKDKNELLALKIGYNIIFIRDYVKEKCKDAYYSINNRYIKEKYNITEEEFLQIVKDESYTKIKKY